MHPIVGYLACIVWWRCRFIRCIYAIYSLLMLLCVFLSLFSLPPFFFPIASFVFLRAFEPRGVPRKPLAISTPSFVGKWKPQQTENASLRLWMQTFMHRSTKIPLALGWLFSLFLSLSLSLSLSFCALSLSLSLSSLCRSFGEHSHTLGLSIHRMVM